MARPGPSRRPQDLPAIIAVVGISVALIDNIAPPIRLASLLGGVVIAVILNRGDRPLPPMLVPGPAARGRVRLSVPTETKILLGAGIVGLPHLLSADNRTLMAAAATLLGAVVLNGLLALFLSARHSVVVRLPTIAIAGTVGPGEIRVSGPMLGTVSTSLIDLSDATTVHTSRRWYPALVSPGPGVHESVRVRVLETGPLGLLNVTRHHTVKLPELLHVVPPGLDVNLEEFVASAQSFLDDDEVVGLREAQPGASLREVHWPSVLRTGRLIVRQRSTLPQTVDLVVELEPQSETNPSTSNDTILSLAIGAGQALLRSGRQVRLHYLGTSPVPEPYVVNPDIDNLPDTVIRVLAGPRVALISDETTLHKTLAVAAPGAVPRPSGGAAVVVDTKGVNW